MPVKIEKKMSKAAAIKAAQSSTASKRKIVQSKPASKKAASKKKGATVAPKKKDTALAVDPKRQAKAIEIDGRMASAVKSMISGSEEVVEIASEMEKGGHWKDLPEKYTSFTAWMNKYAEQAHVSIRTLKGGISFAKATPQLSAAERKKIGPRKGAKITAAAKAAEAKGQTLDPEILDKAPERTEAEVHADLVARGLIVETQPTAESEYHEPTFDESPQYAPGYSREELERYILDKAEPIIGAQSTAPDTGPFEDVPHATPEPAEDSDAYSVQLSRQGTSLEAVNAVQAIYPELNLGDANAIEWILADWLKTQCRDDVRFPDQTNAQAADSLKPKKVNGKRKK